ncbi:MAG: tRNA epoxyqueuosine(34) reductase QueG [Candidatus Sumerlaeia bacterium]|nr:tRNA epoxyqueuosine(34) reductase QueG [Candidatus Sumerlaeia bacterium]
MSPIDPEGIGLREEPPPNHDLPATARAIGFDWVGVARAEPLREELENLRSWLAEGRHGSMAWLAREPERRADPVRVLEDCRSVVVVGVNYLRSADWPHGAEPPLGFGVVSKYARTRDYHRVLEGMGRRLGRALSDRIAPGSEHRFLVDYGPVMERPWAVRAGLGFQGKHTLLIHPREGSFHFLGVLLTTAELEPTAAVEEPMPDCGACRRCIDACPTGAITEPHRLDARRCLSYLTIEHEGEVPEEFWPHFEGAVFGCDICQDVCPYNRSRARPVAGESPLGAPVVAGLWSLSDLLAIRGEQLAAIPVATPLRRAGADRLARNAAIVAGERGTREDLDALRGLAADTTRPAWLRSVADRCARRLEARLA